MRIFNWVHRRFIPKDGSNDEQKLRKDDDDKHKEGIQLLSHDPAAEGGALLFDNYHAIFSIGTFGQLKHHDHDRSSFESWEDDDEDGIVEADDESDDDDDHPLLYTSRSTKTADIVNVAVEEEEEDDDGMERKKERTTLAELFSAESKDDQKTTTINTAPKHEAAGSLFVKKKSSSTRPIHKLHGLMKRMLKRKIHPAADFDKPAPKISVSHHPADTPTHHHQYQQLWT